jgi:hypothetical protein
MAEEIKILEWQEKQKKVGVGKHHQSYMGVSSVDLQML